MLGHSCCVCFSIVVASGSYSQFEVHGLLIAVASLVVEQGLQGAWASVVAACGFSSFFCSWTLEYRLSSVHVGSSQTGDGTHVSCIGRQSLTEPLGNPLLEYFFTNKIPLEVLQALSVYQK